MDRTPPPDRRRTRSQAAGDALLAIVNPDLPPAYANVQLMNNLEEEADPNLPNPNLIPPLLPNVQVPIVPIVPPQVPIIQNNPAMNNAQEYIVSIVELLPAYDGKSDVNVYLQKIELVRPQIPDASLPFFLTLIKLKLEGTAATHIAGINCPTVEIFSDALRDRFQFLQRVENYQVQLATMRQDQKEKMTDYANRITKVLNKLNQAFTNETGIPLTPEIIAMNNRQGIQTFIDGLSHTELRMTLRLRAFDSIAEAITAALEIKTRITNTQSNTPTYRPAIVCNYCKRTGHVDRDCRSKAYQNDNRNPLQNQYVPNNLNNGNRFPNNASYRPRNPFNNNSHQANPNNNYRPNNNNYRPNDNNYRPNNANYRSGGNYDNNGNNFQRNQNYGNNNNNWSNSRPQNQNPPTNSGGNNQNDPQRQSRNMNVVQHSDNIEQFSGNSQAQELDNLPNSCIQNDQ